MACLDREFLWVLVTSFVVAELGSFGSGVSVEVRIPRASAVAIRSERGSALVLPLEGLRRPGAVNRRLEYEAQWEEAHMTLHDDLLTKGTLDFIPDNPSSYQTIGCTSQECITGMCDGRSHQCKYERMYAEMSFSKGLLGKDLLGFGPTSRLQPQPLLFGCETAETGDLYLQHADGIMGLGRGPLSIVDQLVGNGVMEDSFSLCYGGMDEGGGSMVLGAIPTPSGMVFAKSDPTRRCKESG